MLSEKRDFEKQILAAAFRKSAEPGLCLGEFHVRTNEITMTYPSDLAYPSIRDEMKTEKVLVGLPSVSPMKQRG